MNKVKPVVSTMVAFLLFGIVYSHGTDGTIKFTDAEKAFIRENPAIQLGVDPKFVPFEFIDEDNEYKGIAKDYLDLIAQRTGLTFNIRKDLTWPEAYDMALNGELDALPAVGKTPERDEKFLLSEPYYYFKRVIATKDTDTHISGLEDLEGLAVAVQRNSSHHSYLLSYEKINLSLYDSVESALAAVATGEEVAFIGNLATTNYLIRTNGLTNLRFVSFEAEKQQALYFAARKDWPELISIFNKAVSSITDKEKNAINNKWIELDTQLEYGPILKVIKIVAFIFLIVIGVSYFWILRLQKEIRRRKQIQEDLEKANSEADKANEELQNANNELAKITMLDGLTGISNRRYFDSFLQKLWDINMREKFPISLIMIDIDNFKNYNDTYGHLAGDKCLKYVAAKINETVKRAGDFVARFGGEEFAVLLSNTKESGAEVLAERIRKNIEGMEIWVEGRDAPVTVSLGVTTIMTTKERNPNDLIKSADDALYKAKEAGRNIVMKSNSKDQ